MTDEELTKRCFTALMNDRKLSLPLSDHYKRYMLKQRIAAIIPIVQAEQRERDARNKEIMKKLRQYPDAGLTEPVREIDAHSSLHTLATAIRKGDAAKDQNDG